MDGLDSRAALLLFLFLVQRESLCEAAERRTVRAGDTVTLDCDITHQKKTIWFVQRDDEAPFQLISAHKIAGSHDNVFWEASKWSSPHLSPVWKSSAPSISLRIQNITETDLALYYCAEIDGTELTFGNRTRLVYEGQKDISPPAPCVLSWALLGCVSAGCLLLSGCLCCLWSRRGGVQCVGQQRSPMQSRSEGAVQNEGSDVSYHSLKIPTHYQHPRARAEETAHRSTYSVINYIQEKQ
ncbi:uncharacterized protein LOC136771951 isoform X2 [Amia ocellicauda]|uniref:uncharacterized protein LOC136771951 isoform X2 n=1 Tax=Amia ocellicauda TaxID=2972642 RepID=UPI0034643735